MDQPLSIAEFMRELETASQGVGGGIELLLRTMEPAAAKLLRAAAIPHGFDAELLRVLEPALNPAEAERMCVQFLKLSMVATVDGMVRLHDEARRHLFQGWLAEDRRAAFGGLSDRLARHFAAVADRTTGATQAAAANRHIFHLLGADLAAGFTAFKARFRQARAQYALAECEALLSLVKEYGDLIDPVRRLWLTHFDGNLYTDLRRFEAAEVAYRAVVSDERTPSQLRARSLYRLGNLERDQRSWADAAAAYGQALEIVRAVPETEDLEYRILDGLAAVQRETDALDEAAQTLEAGIKLATAKQDLSALATSYNSLGMLLQKQGDTQPALAAFERSLALLEQLQERFRQAQVFNNLGLAHADMAQWQKSRDYLERCLEIERERAHTLGQAKTLSNLVRVFIALNEERKGVEAAERAAALFIDLRDWFHAATVKRTMGRILRRKRQVPEARTAFGEALALFQQAGTADEIESTRQELEQIERRHHLPWYVWVALGLLVLGVLLSIFYADAAELN
ncbi:MAG: tetratricopeptide repeat protein [Dongiaceae bacterium]